MKKYKVKTTSIQSLVRIDGERDIIFPTIRDGKTYFTTKRKQLKGTGTLMALYKKSNGKWIGIEQN